MILFINLFCFIAKSFEIIFIIIKFFFCFEVTFAFGSDKLYLKNYPFVVASMLP